MSQLQQLQDAITDELLTTKLAPPRLRSPLISREPLLARLDQGLDHKLTLLSAPAGFGKTTLVSQWLSERAGEQRGRGAGEQFSPAPLPLRSPAVLGAAWLALDPGDNDPVRFWRYVLTACQRFDGAIGASALALLRTSPQPPFEALLTMVINELHQLAGRYVLVLEDYHFITSPPIHALVTFWLDHLPPTVHLILITRSDPPLPLARLRARGDLYELRAADLRFSRSETQVFLHQALPFPLPPETVERLDSRTEGWPAGLRLVALTLQGQTEAEQLEQFVTTFAGSHRPILEYLIADVFKAQPEPLQEFLLQTSVLTRLTGSLCEAITGRADSGLLLEALERANLFLLPLDAAGQWYRYHALFAEAMQHYARQRLGEARLRELAGKASHWYEGQGLLVEAVEAALSAQTFDRAASLIERLIAPRLVQNEYHTLRRWIERLPEAALRRHPNLCLTYAIAILFTSDRYAPETLTLLQPPLQMAEQTWQAEGNRPKLGEVLAFRSLVAFFQQDLGQAFAEARQGLELLPEENAQWRGISLVFVGLEELLDGRLNTARQTLLRALELCQRGGNIHGVLDTTLLLGRVCFEQGELRQAARLYQQVLIEIEQAPMDRGMAQIRRGRALSGLAALDLEWNELETAGQYISQTLEIGQAYVEPDFQFQSALLLVRWQHVRGETAQAQQRLHSLMAETKHPWRLREVQAHLARLALAAGDLAAVQRWAAARAQLDDVPRLQQEQEALILARLLIAQGEADAALLLLDQWQAEAQVQGRTRSDLEMMILTALAHFSQHHLPQAKQTLSAALTLAQAEGYQRLFLDEGEPMAALLQAILPEVKATPLGGYVRTLLLAFRDFGLPRLDMDFRLAHPIQNPKSKIQNLIEPLSPQEERVLRLLAAGLSNPEIAEELVVSLNTVKTQVQSIYRKLDVHSREEASDVARQLKLL